MCGLLGYSFRQGKLSSARRAVLATVLATKNDERGGHSWGLVGIGDDVKVMRGLGDLGDSAYELCGFNTLFAHTRWASTGEVTIENAHPFKIGNILGAHNGMILNHEEMSEKYKRNFEVDSMHIFAHINENRPLNELIGYGAIEWIKRNDPSTIYLSKLVDGELAIYGIGDQNNTDGIIWSSSFKHAQQAIQSAGLEESAFRYQVHKGRVFVVHNGRLKVDQARKMEITKYNPPPDNKAVVRSRVLSSKSNYDMYRAWTRFYAPDDGLAQDNERPTL